MIGHESRAAAALAAAVPPKSMVTGPGGESSHRRQRRQPVAKADEVPRARVPVVFAASPRDQFGEPARRPLLVVGAGYQQRRPVDALDLDDGWLGGRGISGEPFERAALPYGPAQHHRGHEAEKRTHPVLSGQERERLPVQAPSGFGKRATAAYQLPELVRLSRRSQSR